MIGAGGSIRLIRWRPMFVLVNFSDTGAHSGGQICIQYNAMRFCWVETPILRRYRDLVQVQMYLISYKL